MTAAFLSGLVFPGAGQIYLKRPARGWPIVLLALAAAGYLAAQVIGPALAIADQIAAGTMALDPVAIALRLEQGGQSANPFNTLAALVMLACWVGSTIDAYLLGRGSPA